MAANLLELRRAREWTLDDLAERMTEIGYPMARSTISKIESNARPNARPDAIRKVSVDDMFALARAFEVPPEKLLLSPDNQAVNELVVLLDWWSELERQVRDSEVVAAMAQEELEHSRAELRDTTEQVREAIVRTGLPFEEIDEQIRIRFGLVQANLMRELLGEALR